MLQAGTDSENMKIDPGSKELDATYISQFVHFLISDLSWKFHENTFTRFSAFTRFSVMLVTDMDSHPHPNPPQKTKKQKREL